MKILDRRQKLA